jgi:hypothetical protein
VPLPTVHVLDEVAELGRESAAADELQVAGSADVEVVLRSTADHVEIDGRHHAVERHRRVVRVVPRTEQAALLRGVPDEQHRAPRTLRRRGEHPSDLEQRDASAPVVVRPVVDGVEPGRAPDRLADLPDAFGLRRRRLARGVVGATRAHDLEVRPERIVIHRGAREPYMVAVCGEHHVLVAERGVASRTRATTL